MCRINTFTANPFRMSKKQSYSLGKVDVEGIIEMKKEASHSSKFLNDLYNTPGKYDKFKKSIDEFVLGQVDRRRQEILNDARYDAYTLPLGFKQPMMLSEPEEKVIAAAVLDMAHRIHDGKYVIHNDCLLTRIEVEDRQQRDVPMPYIKLSVRCLKTIAPKHGFYLSGIFKREKLLKEIIHAHIDKIVFLTESMEEKLLMTL